MNFGSTNLETFSAVHEKARTRVQRDSDPNFYLVTIAILLFSTVLLIPCFWQSHIQAADLGSHIYNAWLAAQIHQGALPGLWISSRSNNILFDAILEWLFVRVGPDLAQRIAVAACVLLFGWGSTFFMFRISGRNWWLVGPCVAMLSYGFIFHIGFFNFYLSIGLCLWYLAFFWNASWKVRIAISPILILAWIAHPFPVVWALGTAAYVAIASAVRPQLRVALLMCGIAVLMTGRFILEYRYPTTWSIRQIFFVTGANQLELFGTKYSAAVAGVLFVWLLQFRKLLKQSGIRTIFPTIPFELWALNAAAVTLIPDRVFFPQFALPFGFIVDRLSLGAGLMICALLAAVPMGRLEKAILVITGALFFCFLYADDRDLNRMEDRMDAIVARLPPGARVITPLSSQSLRSLCLQHDVDRACIGHCYAYANYEAASHQFRIRAQPNNGVVMDRYKDVDAVANATYIVRPEDIPLSLLYVCGTNSRDICSRSLSPGEIIVSVIHGNGGNRN